MNLFILFLPASLVLITLDGALGSPVPILLVATTLNSYSTQGFSSTAIADSMSPLITSGTADSKEMCGSLRNLKLTCSVSMASGLCDTIRPLEMIHIKDLICQNSQLGFWHCGTPEKTQIEGYRGELSAYSQMHHGRCLCVVLSELLLSNMKGMKKEKKNQCF